MKNNHLSGPVKVTKNTEKLVKRLFPEIIKILMNLGTNKFDGGMNK